MGDISALWQQEQANVARSKGVSSRPHCSQKRRSPTEDDFDHVLRSLPLPQAFVGISKEEVARERERGFEKARGLEPGESILEHKGLALDEVSTAGCSGIANLDDKEEEKELEEDDFFVATSSLLDIPFVRESAPPPLSPSPPSSPRPAHTIIFETPSKTPPPILTPLLVRRPIKRKVLPGPSPLSQSHLPSQPESDSDANSEDEGGTSGPYRYAVAGIPPPYRSFPSSLPPSLASHLLSRPVPNPLFPLSTDVLLPAVDILSGPTTQAGAPAGLGFGTLNVPLERNE
ncbi:hypothetical protein IAR50_002421 [Cryptococcus sp. DSM 104548]